jgi:hypothetical protein
MGSARRPSFTGFVLSDGRRGGMCWDEKPRCVEPHRLITKQREPILTEAITTCQYRAHTESTPCGVRLYVAQLTFGGSAAVRGTGERAWLVVELTPEHVERMRREPMIFLERMVILGVALPGVEIDVLGQVGLNQGKEG